MKTMRWIAAVALAVVVAAPAAQAQEPPKPGPEHEILKKQEGTWDTTMKAGGMEFKGKVRYKMELGGLWLVSSPFARSGFAALAGWTKFAALIVAPMWITYRLTREQVLRALAGFAVATLAAFSILLLEPNLGHALRVFWDRTIPWQLSRDSPFSIWDWRQYHAKGIPNLHVVQRFLQALLVAAALVFALVPRRKTPLQLAALTGVLLLGFELVLTHWSYLYIPWFFPFVAYAILAPGEPVPEPVPDEHPVPELVAAG